MSTDTAAEPDTGSPGFPGTLGVTIVFRSDWGVSTGTGVAGGVDAVVEKDGRDLPVVRGTVLTGAIREQAFVVAEALDGDSENKSKGWHRFVGALFGSVGRARLVSFSDARFVSFSDGAVGSESKREAVHEVVSLSIDDDTGTAREDFLRFIERAGPCTLAATATLLDADVDGRPLVWDEGRRRAARLLLALSGLLVRGIGSDRSNGDGACDVLVGAECGADAAAAGGEDDAAAAKKEVKDWCREQVRGWAAAPGAVGAAVPRAPRAEADPDGITSVAVKSPRKILLGQVSGTGGARVSTDKLNVLIAVLRLTCVYPDRSALFVHAPFG